MSLKNKSRYNKIVTDSRLNGANGDLGVKRLTVEEYYDLLHHTHALSDLFTEKISEVDGQDVTLKQLLETIQDNITTLKKDMDDFKSGVITVEDYDIDTPGIQDAEGNTIFSAAGMTFIELKDK